MHGRLRLTHWLQLLASRAHPDPRAQARIPSISLENRHRSLIPVTFSPRSPGGPGSPVGPVRPFGPSGPSSPLEPGTPASPCVRGGRGECRGLGWGWAPGERQAPVRLRAGRGPRSHCRTGPHRDRETAVIGGTQAEGLSSCWGQA